MSKNRYSKMQGNMQYNRPSGGYQKNVYKQMLNANDVKAPKAISEKTIKYGGIAIGATLIVLIIVLTILLKWKGLLIGLVIGTAVSAALWFYMNSKQKEMISYYKKIGMTEEMYINELRKRNNNPKQLEAARRQWRRVKQDSVVQQIR
ncbi:MAG: hypothetical protein E7219_07055 [Clostridiales bacterium]|nr:hypothetical protein [Clostridiales bacterium]